MVNLSDGVPVDDVKRRRDGYGTNAKEKKPLRTVCQILCAILEDFMLRVLLVASIITIIINLIVDEEKSTGLSFFIINSMDRWCSYILCAFGGLLSNNNQ